MQIRDERFIARTFRSTAVVTVVVLFFLLSYGQSWALVPVLAGVGLSALLLWGWGQFIRGVFTPERARQDGKKSNAPTRALWVFALIKYPLVGLLLWVIARNWDTRQLIAFIGGFVLLHIVIALRALGSVLTGAQGDEKLASSPRSNDKRNL